MITGQHYQTHQQMTKQELWDSYVSRNPSFHGDGNITMTAAGLKKFFDQTYNKGFERGKQVATAFSDKCCGNTSKVENPFKDIFGSGFGGK